MRNARKGGMYRPFEQEEDGKDEDEAVINDIFKELEKLNSFNFQACPTSSTVQSKKEETK